AVGRCSCVSPLTRHITLPTQNKKQLLEITYAIHPTPKDVGFLANDLKEKMDWNRHKPDCL
ncbi:MAG TPA: hypothetical protein VJB90_02470, partial [Candidatus Nanoarchaeia archaeon]|nr:hypothetical protein [Candidatus Nanoarchaeia archaeon]